MTRGTIKMICFLSILLMLGLHGTASAARLRNKGFESRDASEWMVVGEGWRTSAYSKDSYRGIYGQVNDVWTNAMDKFRVISQKLKAKPGKTYKASVWLRTVCIESSESFLEIQFMDKGQQVLTQFQSAHVTNDQNFVLMSIEKMKAPANTKWVSIRGVVCVLATPTANIDYHIFDNFDFRPERLQRR